MAELLKIKTHTTSVFDFIGAGVVKSIEEPLLTPIIGNGTIWSGAGKAIIAALLDGRGGRIGNVAAIGFGVDAGEDIVRGLLGGGLGGLFGGGQQRDEFGG